MATAISEDRGFSEIPRPNITNIFCGREIGYAVEPIIRDEKTEAISATRMRQLRAAPSTAI